MSKEEGLTTGSASKERSGRPLAGRDGGRRRRGSRHRPPLVRRLLLEIGGGRRQVLAGWARRGRPHRLLQRSEEALAHRSGGPGGGVRNPSALGRFRLG